MAEAPEPRRSDNAEIQARLDDAARKLREAGPLDPAAQRPLAELVDELNKAMAAGKVPPAEVAHLAESTAHLAESLHQRPGEHPRSALDRLEQSALAAEARAPAIAGLAHQLLEALASIGI
jgi:hypothetical protein